MAATAIHRLTLDSMGKCSNAFFSETTNMIKAKLYMNVHWIPASTLRIHNVAVWLLFGQVPVLRENYVATTYFRNVICKSL